MGSDVGPHAYVSDYEGSDVESAKNTLNYHQFGVLYNFSPTDAEWTAMTSSLGSDAFSGSMMKSNLGDSWNGITLQEYYWNGTNLSGFSGLPGGYRDYLNGFFGQAGSDGYWWSSSPDGSSAWFRGLSYSVENVFRYYDIQGYGISVRCVRDTE